MRLDVKRRDLVHKEVCFEEMLLEAAEQYVRHRTLRPRKDGRRRFGGQLSIRSEVEDLNLIDFRDIHLVTATDLQGCGIVADRERGTNDLRQAPIHADAEYCDLVRATARRGKGGQQGEQGVAIRSDLQVRRIGPPGIEG